jgi:hypothetical protein
MVPGLSLTGSQICALLLLLSFCVLNWAQLHKHNFFVHYTEPYDAFDSFFKTPCSN